MISVDVTKLFATRIIRLFAYGFLSVVLALFLAALGLPDAQIGVLLTLTLMGDFALSLLITTRADRIGRRRMLMIGAGLMALAGLIFAVTREPVVLMLAAAIGIVSPGGTEVGPFLAIEQASLSEIIPAERRTDVFAWYNLAGYFSTAVGALAGGSLAQALQAGGWETVDSYRVIVVIYASLGGVLALIFWGISRAVEVKTPPAPQALFSLGLTESRAVVLRLAGLFAIDSFAGGFVVQSLIAYWLHLRFGVDPAVLGGVFFGVNMLAGTSALVAAAIARRIGLINTMVFSHLPSNVLLILIPLMPAAPLAIGLVLARGFLSQMDVPTRQAYVAGVVTPVERSAAMGVSTVVRTISSSLSPALTGLLFGVTALMGVPFFIAGGLKIVYDLLLFVSFRSVKLPEEGA